MKKDAFEKMIVPMLGTKDLVGKNGKWLSSEVATLLNKQHQKQHRKVRRMVKNIHKITVAAFKKSILAALDKRAKGVK